LSFDIPYLDDENIEGTAADLLAKHHPSRTVPVPVERIAEIGLRIRVYPFPELYNTHGLNALLTGDQKVIFVDDKQYREYIPKARFSIAHEVGHHILHWKYCQDLPYRSIDEYVRWRLELPRKVVDRFEIQSHIFAGFLLMPTDELLEVCKAVVDEHKEELKILKPSTDPWPYIADDVAKAFEVNQPSALIRIQNSNIMSRIAIPR